MKSPTSLSDSAGSLGAGNAYVGVIAGVGALDEDPPEDPVLGLDEARIEVIGRGQQRLLGDVRLQPDGCDNDVHVGPSFG
jgi:hypothetical protein